MTERITDEMLMAFVDGELDGATAAEIGRAVAADPALARRAEAFRSSRAAVKAAHAGLLADPPPARLVAAVLGTARPDAEAAAPSPSGGRAFRSQTARPRGWRAALPLAASLALVAGLGGFLAGRLGPPGGADLLGGPTLAAAIGALETGQATEIPVAGAPIRLTVLATYDVEGGLCRSFEALAPDREVVRGIGCAFDGAWHVDIAVSLGTAPEDGFIPAGAGATASLDAYLDTLDARERAPGAAP